MSVETFEKVEKRMASLFSESPERESFRAMGWVFHVSSMPPEVPGCIHTQRSAAMARFPNGLGGVDRGRVETSKRSVKFSPAGVQLLVPRMLNMS